MSDSMEVIAARGNATQWRLEAARLERELEEAYSRDRKLSERVHAAEAAAEEARQAATYWQKRWTEADDLRRFQATERAREQADLAEARQELKTVREALRRIADWDSKHLRVPEPGFPAQIALQMRDEARAALQPTPNPEA